MEDNMSITFRVLLAVALILSFNLNNVMAEEINFNEFEPEEFNHDNQNINLLPNDYWFYLDKYVNDELDKRIESWKILRGEERMFMRKDWNGLEKRVEGLANATNTILPEYLSNQLQEQIGYIEYKTDFIGTVNTFLNTEETRILVFQEITEILKFCEEMMDEVIELKPSSEWNPWWKEAFELRAILEEFLEKMRHMLFNTQLK